MPGPQSFTRDDKASFDRLDRDEFAGKTVLLVHPAWHSCGSHQVFVSQAQAYRALGAQVISLAVADYPGWTAGSKAHQTYLARTNDLIAHRRLYAGMPPHRIARRAFLDASIQWLRGNAAAMLRATVHAADLDVVLRDLPRIDLIHCNHFFLMPAARRIRRDHSCPVLLDTHDIQARQFTLRNEGRLLLPPKARFEDMLAIEIAEMEDADLLIHLNDEEAQSWQVLLPAKRHALIYPAVAPVPTGPGGTDIIIVASANHPNFLSVKWFLEEVRPRAASAPLRIIGNIDQMMKARSPALFAQHAALFAGRLDDLSAAYAKASFVLLPTVSGHGLSIKTVEALSSGAALIATPEAFRGIAIDPTRLGNVTLVKDAVAFAEALAESTKQPPAAEAARQASDSRQLYDRLFSAEAYAHALANAVRSLPAAKSA